MYNKISPLFMMELIEKINQQIWNKFATSKYKNVERYLRKWQEDSYWYWQYYDFEIIYKEGGSEIDLLRTLDCISNEKIIRIAHDLWIPTPWFIPIVHDFQLKLWDNYKNAEEIFLDAIQNIDKKPHTSIERVNATLESIIKHILEDENFWDIKNSERMTLYDLTQEILKKISLFPWWDIPKEINTIGSSLMKISQTIEWIRSDKTWAHGKWKTDEVFKNNIGAYFIVNSVATVGLFLIQFYEKNFSNNKNEDEKFSDINIEDIPF